MNQALRATKAAPPDLAEELALLRQPAIALDRLGCVIAINAAAEGLLDAELRVTGRRLTLCDRRAASDLASIVERLPISPEPREPRPIVVRRDGKRPLIIRVLPIDEAPSGARALLLLTDLQQQPAPDPNLVAHAFELTRAEARLAALVAAGATPDEAARRLGVGRETVRSQLKAVFAKTGTHRQSELAALLLRLVSLLLGALPLELACI